MKKTLLILGATIAGIIIGAGLTAQAAAPVIATINGGTGLSSLPKNMILVGNATSTISSTSSPTVGYITATSTTATSTFANGIQINGGCLTVGGSCLTNNTGTVTSVSGSGGTTGFALNGGPITTSGTLTLSGTLGLANGGTNATAYPLNSLLFSNGTNFTGTSSPTVGYIVATSTTATSTLANGVNLLGGCVEVNGACISSGSGGGTTAIAIATSTSQTTDVYALSLSANNKLIVWDSEMNDGSSNNNNGTFTLKLGSLSFATTTYDVSVQTNGSTAYANLFATYTATTSVVINVETTVPTHTQTHIMTEIVPQ